MTHPKVTVRVRPLSCREIESGSTSILSIEHGRTVAITNIKVPEQNAGDSRERIRRFTFDFCFNEDSSQNDVFLGVNDFVKNAFREYKNSCVLAYGQSSSGKTHTMMGFPHDPGLIPRLCERIFTYVEECKIIQDEQGPNSTKISYLEIYNEKVRDLLSDLEDSNGKELVSLRVRQHPKKGLYVQGLTEHSVANSSNLLKLLQLGNGHRKVAATLNNPQSSRSHVVLVVTHNGIKLTLVDLAGSERAGKPYYNSSRFREGANINKSLVALGNVISALAEHSSKTIKRKFIPYRDSVLTWLLKDTLGGDSNTIMIATVSPSNTCYNETINTLRFGQRAKLIVSTPVIYEDPKEKIIRELRTEIARLKELLVSQIKIPELPQISQELLPTPVMASTIKSDKEDCLVSPPLQSPNSDESTTASLTRTETLVPVINVSPSVITKKPPQKLKRTFSVEHAFSSMHQTAKKFGSVETITSSSNTRRRPSTPLRKLSINNSNPSLKTLPKKVEKGISTETMSSLNVEARTARKSPSTNPRSRIVTAVTNRLYGKANRKDAGTNTSNVDVVGDTPKELKICSNARERLKELTRKALRAHRSRDVEVQTDLFPVLRVKETSTDVTDLKIDLKEVKTAATSTPKINTEDKSIDCQFLKQFAPDNQENLGRALVVTRSCSTQFDEKSGQYSGISFTKYLGCFNKPGSDQSCSRSVDINVPSNSDSDDSLNPKNDTKCFPDLISNHNSLEPQHQLAADKRNSDILQTICHASYGTSAIPLLECQDFISVKPDWVCQYLKAPPAPNPPVCHAEEKYIASKSSENCLYFPSSEPERVVVKIIQPQFYSDDCIIITEPIVLKSIIKLIPTKRTTTASNCSPVGGHELPDSLEYHRINTKKVRFDKSKSHKRERIYSAMSQFLKEATVLLHNLTTMSTAMHDEYDIEIAINEMPESVIRSDRDDDKSSKNACTQTNYRKLKCSGVQTTRSRYDASTQYENFHIPVNKYEQLVEDSCQRLEDKINMSERTFSTLDKDIAFPNLYQSHLSVADDLHSETQSVVFSDYGSLPRRSHKSTYSPSAYLKELISLRKQLIDSSNRDSLETDRQEH